MKSGGSLSIWFFMGISLAVNGAIIFARRIYELVSPPVHPVVLYNLHANVWWGGLWLLLGDNRPTEWNPMMAETPVASLQANVYYRERFVLE